MLNLNLNVKTADQVAMCVVCGSPVTPSGEEANICQRCGGGLAVRRGLAFLVDLIVWLIFNTVTFTGLELVGFPEVLVDLLNWAARFLFLFKDGFSGYSPGKFVFGIRVIDVNTGSPADFLDSFRRNIPLLFPLVPIIIAFQLGRATRWGDGWAGTRVVLARR